VTRREWMAMLAKLTAPLDAVTATRGLCDMLPLLADFPDSAWCVASLDHVAGQCSRVPVYSEVRRYLGQWWGPRDPTPRLPPPPVAEWRVNIPKPRDPPTEAELAATDEIMRNFRMQTGYARSSARELGGTTPQPKPLSDGALLAQWEAMGPAGAIRAAALRRKIAATAGEA